MSPRDKEPNMRYWIEFTLFEVEGNFCKNAIRCFPIFSKKISREKVNVHNIICGNRRFLVIAVYLEFIDELVYKF